MRFLYWLSSRVFQEEGQAAGISRATRECWLMHAARLLAFFYGPRYVARAVLAEDYFADSEVWYESRPVRPTGLDLGQQDLPSPASLVAYGPDSQTEAMPRARRLLEVTSGLVELSASFLGRLDEERLPWFGPSSEGERPWWTRDLDGELNGERVSGEEDRDVD